MDCLRTIVQESGAGICLSSNWRLDSWGIDQVNKHLRIANLAPIIGFTHPVEDHFNTRADEVMDWLNQHPEVTHFIVLDDVALNFEDPEAAVADVIAARFVQTDETKGLQTQDVAAALSKLEAAFERSSLVRARLLDAEADEAEDSVKLPPLLEDEKPPEPSAGRGLGSGLGSRTPSCSSFATLSTRALSSNNLSGLAVDLAQEPSFGNNSAGMGSRTGSGNNIGGMSRISSNSSISGMVRLSRRESRGNLEGLARD